MLVAVLAAGSLSLVGAAPPDQQPNGNDKEPKIVPGHYIVIVNEDVDPAEVAGNHGVAASHVYDKAAKGFAAELGPVGLLKLKLDPRVNNIVPDTEIQMDPPVTGVEANASAPKPKPTPTPQPQPLPTGINRIDAEAAALGDAAVRVAVIDTGISPHKDLSVTVNVNFVFAERDTLDRYGHGTHVAGTIGAKIDGEFRGVAPGVELVNLKVCNRRGSCRTSDIIAALNWIVDHKGDTPVQVANMSLGGYGTSDNNCGYDNSTVIDPYHAAICAVTKSGTAVVVAAGNESTEAKNTLPAGYPEVIAVSAIADFNGYARGGAPATCRSDVDDTLADFSNFGDAVDIAAPGVCILSTYNNGGYAIGSGTSMASPHVAGAIALLVSQRTIDLRPSSDAKAARDTAMNVLESLAMTTDPATVCGYFTDDKDGIAEPLLNLGTANTGTGVCALVSD